MMSPDATQSSPDSQVFTFNTANSFSISNTINNNSNGNSNNDQNSGQQKLLNQLLSELNQLVDNKSNNSLVIDKESRRLLIDLLQKHMKTSRFKHPVKTGSTNRVTIPIWTSLLFIFIYLYGCQWYSLNDNSNI